MPSDYQLFVKKHMHELRDSDLVNTEKFKHIAMLWKRRKEEYESESDEEHEHEHRRKPKAKPKPKRQAKSKKDIDLSELLEILQK